MAEKTILVCDGCGAPAVQTVGLKVSGRNLQKDVCAEHLADLTNGAKPARRGRRRGQTVTGGVPSTAKRRGRPPKTAAKRRRRPPKAVSSQKRRGRPRKQATAMAAAALV